MVIRDVCSCLNGDTNTTYEAGHHEVVTHIIHPASLPLALVQTEYQPCAFHTLSKKCSGMSHARRVVAAATLNEAEVFCQCAVCLRKMQ